MSRSIVSILSNIPYIERTNVSWFCEAFYTEEGGRKKKCSQFANFKFVKSKSKGPGRHKTGYYCTTHTIRAMQSSKYEKARAERAYNKALKESDGNV